jgi:hypothetical protein
MHAMPRLPAHRALACAIACIFAGLSPSLADEASGSSNESQRQRASAEGLSVELRVEPLDETADGLLANRDLAISFRITDQAGDPARGLDAAAWLDLQAGGQEAVSCKDKVRSYVGGLLSYQPQINLAA